ncbi:MAG: MATE family efflux transporter [Balneolales bacterium]
MNKQILRLAIPNIISNLSIPLLSSVDTALVGHLGEVYYLGAIAVGGMIFNFIYWGFGFLRMGTTGLTAQAYGQKNNKESLLVFSRALIVAATGSAVLLLFQKPILDFTFTFVGSSPEVEEYARIYFNIRIWAAPATLSMYGIQGWFLGMQNAKDPMLMTIFVNLLNILFNIIFIYRFGMTVDGVAYGTVAAAYLGLLFGLFLLLKRYNHLRKAFEPNGIIDLTGIKQFFFVNRDILIRTLCVIFAFSFFTAKSAEFGDDILAANTILLQLWAILSYGVDGFAYAAESLSGRYIGAKDHPGLIKAIKYTLGWGLGMGAGIAVIYILFGGVIVSLFTDNQTIITLALSYFAWTAAAPLINSLCFIWDGIFLGATATKPMRNSMLAAIIIVYLPVYYSTIGFLGNHALWLSMTLFMVFRGLTLTWYARKEFWENSR